MIEKNSCGVVRVLLLLITIVFVFAVDVMFVLGFYAYTQVAVTKHILFN